MELRGRRRHCPSARIDLTVGGTHKARMEAKDGSFGFDFEGTYAEVDAPRSLTLVLRGGRKSRTTFRPSASGTLVETTFDAEAENPVEMQRDGWQAILNNYKRHAEQASVDYWRLLSALIGGRGETTAPARSGSSPAGGCFALRGMTLSSALRPQAPPMRHLAVPKCRQPRAGRCSVEGCGANKGSSSLRAARRPLLHRDEHPRAGRGEPGDLDHQTPMLEASAAGQFTRQEEVLDVTAKHIGLDEMQVGGQPRHARKRQHLLPDQLQ